MNLQYVEMGKRISLRRKELNMSQNQLAEKLNISNNHISSIENGREKMSLDLFTKICNELQVTPDYLLLGSMHANDISQNIVDSLRLCRISDLEIIESIIQLYVNRNRNQINNSPQDL